MISCEQHFVTSMYEHNAGHLPLEFDQRRAELLLPATGVHVMVLSHAGALGAGSWAGEPLAEMAVTPRTGQRLELRLDVRAPPSTAELETRR